MKTAILMIAAVTLVGCTTDKACSLVACTATATESLPIPAVPGAQLTACRNADCATATLSTPDASTTTSLDFGRLDLGGSLVYMDDDYFIQVYWIEVASPVDGDRYTLTATDPAGQTISSVAQTATYTSRRPNGPGCEPVCETATLAVPDGGGGELNR
jgi:hypothetical protein